MWPVWIIESVCNTILTLLGLFVELGLISWSVQTYYLLPLLPLNVWGCVFRAIILRHQKDKRTNVFLIRLKVARSSFLDVVFTLTLSFGRVHSTSNRPRATGKILLTTCKARLGSDRKGSQQRAKVTNTVEAILTNRKNLHEESHTERQASWRSSGGTDIPQIMLKKNRLLYTKFR